ncbi:MAG TPA: lysophospholipid acyltransferase family protein [Candidatus Binatia bacterium]|nr:lysophospholipid acyltransferase family protein [Candidatus Binatia bacterium]
MFGKSSAVRAPRRRLRWPDALSATAAKDVVWSFRHLGSLHQVDWTAASRDTRLIAILDRAFAGLYDHYFRMEARGWENIPPGPVLLVGNHSGFGVAELLMLLVAWWRHFGPTRPAYALAHRWLYKTPFLRVIVPKIGGVPTSWRSACEVLDRGDVLAVFPGGEEESTRPFADRYKVQLHGHKGFVRLALENEVPIVPMITIGSHATMILPPGMHVLATVTGARRFLGLQAVPLPLQLLVWILAAIALDDQIIGPMLFFLIMAATPPLYPSKITTVFERPISPAELRRAAAPGEDPLDAGYRLVERLMQERMDALASERRGVFA